LPKVIVFLQLLNAYGPNYFDTIKNWDKEKDKLLSLYGYSLQDDLTGKFEFMYKEGKPFLRVLDPSIKRINPIESSKSYAAQQTLKAANPMTSETLNKSKETIEEKAAPTPTVSQRIGIVVQMKDTFPGFNIEAIGGEVNDEQDQFLG